MTISDSVNQDENDPSKIIIHMTDIVLTFTSSLRYF